MSETDEIQRDEVRNLQARAHGMLPGVAGICLFMLLMTMINAFAALQGKFGTGGGKYGVLALCTLLAAGVFGLLRLRRWGWALVLGGCLTLCIGNLFVFQRTHVGPFLVQGLFAMVFFLYLVRTEVRGRLR
jgi:drug/metabolite transporter (DMT)-like permease